MNVMKKWFVAVLVVECRVGKDPAELWDQQIRLLRALTPEDAFHEAITLGRAENTRYRNRAGEVVTWNFVGLHDLAELGVSAIRSGVEVFSTLTRDQRPRVAQKRQLNV